MASPRPQSGRIRPNSAPSRRASVSTSRSCARHDEAVSLTRRSPSCSPRSMLNALRWSRSITATVSGRLAAARAGQLARQLVVPRAAGRQARQRVRQRERADARAQLLALARDRGLRGQHAEHLRDGVGDGVDRMAPDQDHHADDLVAAQHRLEQRRARARRLHERRRERRVAAGVGDEVGLARGERAPAVLGLGPRLDRHRRDVDADHGGRDELAAGRLEQERDGRRGDLAGGAADGGSRVAAAGQRARRRGRARRARGRARAASRTSAAGRASSSRARARTRARGRARRTAARRCRGSGRACARGRRGCRRASGRRARAARRGRRARRAGSGASRRA